MQTILNLCKNTEKKEELVGISGLEITTKLFLSLL